MQKIKRHFINNKEIWISSGVVFFSMIVIFAFAGLWPFGSNSVAIYDLRNQVIPLASWIIDFFQGKASLFYTNRMGGGINTFSSILYFIVSPLYVLLFLGGRNNMIFLINLIIVAYFLCMTISINYMLKKFFKLNLGFHIVISLAYCFCGYILQNYTFIIWLNYLVLLPFMAVAFKRLIDTQKYLTFSFLIFAHIVSCFGVGTTSMFVLLAIFYLYVILCVDKEKRSKTLTLLTISILIGVLMSSVVIVPILFSSSRGMRAGQLFDYVFTSDVDRSWSKRIMYCALDFVFCLLGLLFVAFSNKKDRINKFLSITLLGLIFIHFVDACVMLLSFGINNGYSTRLNFLLTFVVVLAIGKFFHDLGEEKIEPERATSKTNKYVSMLFMLILILGVVLFVGCILTKFGSIKNIAQPITIHNEVEDDAILLFTLELIVVLPFLIGFMLFKFKKLSIKVMKLAVCILIGCQAVLGGLMFCNMSFSTETFTTMTELVGEYVGTYDKGYYPVKNASQYYDTGGMAVFTSMLSKKSYDAYAYLGYDTKFNYVSGNNGTVFANSLMGLQYKLDYSNSIGKQWTLVGQRTAENDGQKINYYLKKFNYATTGAFLIDDDYSWDWSKNSFENQNLLARAMGASEDIFQVYDLSNVPRDIVRVEMVNAYTKDSICTTYDGRDGSISFYPVSTNNAIYYVLFDEDYYSKILWTNFSRETNPNAIYSFNSGKKIELADGSDFDLSKVHIARLDYDVYNEQFELIKQNEIKIDYYANGCKLQVNNEGGKKLFVSNVNIYGMKAKVNGEQTKVEDVATGFVGVKLSVGQNSVDVYYSSPDLLPSILIVALCLGLAILVAILYNKGKFNWLDKIVDKAYWIYAICFVGFMYVFTGVLTLVKMIVM